MSETPPLLITKAGQNWTLRLNRPQRLNALSVDLVEALLAALDEAEASRVRMIVLCGEGRNFSAGFDLADLESQSDGDLLLRFVRIELLLQRVAASPCITVALAHGRNFGAGADLFAACQRRIASPDASFAMPGLRFGLVLGTGRLCQLIGADAAREMLQSGRSIEADEGQRLGLVRAVAQAEQWPALVAALEDEAAHLPDAARARMHAVLAPKGEDADLAALVRSAAQPGLRERLIAYAGARRK